MTYKELAERLMQYPDEEVHMCAISFGRHLTIRFFGNDFSTHVISLENVKGWKTKEVGK